MFSRRRRRRCDLDRLGSDPVFWGDVVDDPRRQRLGAAVAPTSGHGLVSGLHLDHNYGEHGRHHFGDDRRQMTTTPHRLRDFGNVAATTLVVWCANTSATPVRRSGWKQCLDQYDQCLVNPQEQP